MKLRQNLGESPDVWNFQTTPYDFTSQFPISNQPFTVVVDQIAPGLVSYAQTIATASDTLVSALIRARSQVAMNDTQRQLLDLQLQRAQAGLPPLNTSAITGTGNQGLTLTGPMILGIAALLIFAMSRR
jgi:hypothetical protein